jgi:hypothetical protein
MIVVYMRVETLMEEFLVDQGIEYGIDRILGNTNYCLNKRLNHVCVIPHDQRTDESL